MALQQNVATRISYKAHSSGVITANTEPVLSSDPGASGAQELRRVSSTLGLQKDTYQSNEVRSDRQIADFRHGVLKPQGQITGEFSPGTYTDLIEAALRCTKVATFDKTESDFTTLTADNATAKLTVGASTWAAQGFRVGDMIRLANMSVSANNSVNFLILSLSTTEAVVSPAPTDNTADSAFTVTRLGSKMTIPIASHVSRKFLLEHYYADIDVTELFTEMRVTAMGLALPASGLSTVNFGFMGRRGLVYTAGASPFFSSPTAPGTAGITAAVNGKLIVGGATIGVVTGIDIKLDMAAEAPAVVGQNIVADILLGRSIVTGTVQALLQDGVLLENFIDEDEVEIICALSTTSAANTPGIALYIPRVKFGGGQMQHQGEGGLPISLPFQALIKPSTTGYDNTTLAISEWTA